MIRLVVAAVLTVATLAAALPAVDDARTARVDAEIERAIDRLERAGTALAVTEDATPTREHAAVRRVEFSLARRSVTTARPAFVAVGGRPGGPGNRSIVAYASGSSPTRLRELSLPVPLRTPDGPVVFRESGRHAVSFALVGEGDSPAIVVSRARTAPGR
ncbi:DUF7311 family protein [Halobellus sp. GM3]|uniref:DUF7311 family protein n=1 Tax=Halobellus sp. GM3 TaxID=3458410 RepID=UPI00403DC821